MLIALISCDWNFPPLFSKRFSWHDSTHKGSLTFFLIWEHMTEQDWMPEFTAWKRMPYDFPNPCMIAATTVANLPAMLEEGKSLPSFHLLSFLFVWLLLLSNLTLTKVALCVREALTFVVIWPPSRCNFSMGLADFFPSNWVLYHVT